MIKFKFYITTAIDYVNAQPHLGHLYEKICADVIARWHRLLAEDVFFLTGTDENAQKNVLAAREAGISVKEFIDGNVRLFQELCKIYNISNDDFIRTTEKRHAKVAQAIFKKLFDSGDIYKSFYEGYYCQGCEAFLTEKDLVNGVCPEHGKKPDWLKEESYFFRLSKYQGKILKLLSSKRFVLPEARRKEVMLRIKEEGLRDISVSRANITWGIDTPIDERHKIYVWIDALTNYISALGYPSGKKYKKFWPADIHLIGKGINWFHSVIWPAILISAGIPLPRSIFVHGYVTVGGGKMSKSMGTVISPLKLAKKYQPDAVRYFLIREIPMTEDGDFSEVALMRRLNNELADIFGNFVHRTLTFIWARFNGLVPDGKIDKELQSEVKRKVKIVKRDLDELKLHAGLEEIMSIAKIGNEYFQHSEPWVKIKENKKEAGNCLFNCVQLVKDLCILFYPFIPAACNDLAEQINIKVRNLDQLNELLEPGHKIKKPCPLFKKVVELEEKKGKEMITQKDFSKLDLRIATITKAEPVGRNLLKIELELAGKRVTTVAGIRNSYEEKELIGKQVLVIMNIKPKKIAGVVSECMLLAVNAKKPVLLVPDKKVESGLKVF